MEKQSATTVQKSEAWPKCEVFYSSYLKNPYRVLGLVGASSQAELKKVAGNIRRQAKVGKAYTSPLDLLWVGVPVSRTERDLLDAETKLLNPETRLLNRLLWFHSPPEDLPPELNADEAAKIAQRWVQSQAPLALHDSAVMMQFAAMADSPDCANPKYWKQAMALWRAVLANETYWTMLCEIDDKLGYEPVCLSSDVFALKEKFMDLVSEPLLLLSKDALNSGDQQLFACAAALLKPPASASTGEGGAAAPGASGAAQGARSYASVEIADEFHRKMTSIADEIAKTITERIDKNEKTYKKNKQKNIDTCGQCESIFKYEVEPILQNASSILPEDDPLLLQLKELAAGILISIANGYTWADDYGNAARVSEQAAPLAANTATEPKLTELLDNFRKNIEMQKMFGEQKKVNSAPTLFTMNTIGFAIYPAMGEQPEPYLGSKRAIYYFVIFMLPILPLASYRIIFNKNGTYSFISRIPLDKFASMHQGALVLLFAWIFIGAAMYKPDPAVTQRNTSAVMNRVSHNAPMPTDKYELKDLVNNDDEAVKDLEGRIAGIKPQLEKKQAEVQAFIDKADKLLADKNTDQATTDALKSQKQQKIDEYNVLLDSVKATAAMCEKILKERNDAAEYYNANYSKK